MSDQITSPNEFLPSPNPPSPNPPFSAISPTPRLDGLPLEVLSHIITYIDQPSAISLARVARQFTSSAKVRIWRELNLMLQPYYGCQPLIRELTWENPRAGATYYFKEFDENDWEWEKQKEANELHVAALRDKILRILSLIAEGTGESRLVQRVRLLPTMDDGLGMYRLLGEVSPTIAELELATPSHHAFEIVDARMSRCTYSVLDGPVDDGLEIQMFRHGISFPALTHLQIQKRSIGYYPTIALLCNASPNLRHLDIEIDLVLSLCASNAYDIERLWKTKHIHHDVSGFVRATKVTRLRLRPYANEFCDEKDTFDLDPVFRSLTQNIPLIQHLSIEHSRNIPHPVLPRILFGFLEPVTRCQSLLDLRWPGAPDFYQTGWSRVMRAEVTDPFPRVRRLALLPDCRVEISKDWPVEANPEVVYLDASPHEALFYGVRDTYSLLSVAETAPHPPVLAVRWTFASQLRRTPRLRLIHFALDGAEDCGLDLFTRLDKLEAAGEVAFTISSLRRGDRELLRIRLRTHWRELSNYSPSDMVEPQPRHRRTLRLALASGDERVEVYEWQDEPIIQYLTDLDGLVVPLEVMEEMRAVEGLSEDKWEKRGVEVGEAAWKVLADWEKGAKAWAAIKVVMEAGYASSKLNVASGGEAVFGSDSGLDGGSDDA